MAETNDATKMYVTLPLAVWGQLVFAVQESRDARLIALLDQTVASAEASNESDKL